MIPILKIKPGSLKIRILDKDVEDAKAMEQKLRAKHARQREAIGAATRLLLKAEFSQKEVDAAMLQLTELSVMDKVKV